MASPAADMNRMRKGLGVLNDPVEDAAAHTEGKNTCCAEC